jgi:hypothetical protein
MSRELIIYSLPYANEKVVFEVMFKYEKNIYFLYWRKKDAYAH